jgi:hypothetical protein
MKKFVSNARNADVLFAVTSDRKRRLLAVP